MRQVTTRNQRAKGVTLKSVLQVCLLVVICSWILYQIKHSYDQKKPDQESAAAKRIHSKDAAAQEFKHKHAQKRDPKTGQIGDTRVVDGHQQHYEEDASREARESSFAGDDASSEVVQAAAPPKSEDSEGYNSSAAKPVDVTETRVARNESDSHMELGSDGISIRSAAEDLPSASDNKHDGAQVKKETSFKHLNTTDEKTDATFAEVIVQGKNDI